MTARKKTYLIAIYPDEKGYCMAKFPDFPELAPDFGKNFDDCVLESSRFLDAVISDKVFHFYNGYKLLLTTHFYDNFILLKKYWKKISS